MYSASEYESATGCNPTARKRLGRNAYILTGFSAVGLICVTGLWLYSIRHADERLAVQVAKVRARGEPLSTVELNDYYRPIQDGPDLTAELSAARAICDTAGLEPITVELPIVGRGPGPPLPPKEWLQLEEVEAYLAPQTSALATFREVARRGGRARYSGDFSAGIAVQLPLLSSIRCVPRMLSLQFYVHLHRGRTSEAVECIIDQMAFASTLDREPDLILQLTRLALVSMALDNLKEAVECQNLSDADLIRLQLALRKIECQASLKLALVGDRAFENMACIEPRLADGSFTPTPAEARLLARCRPARVADAAKILELNLRICEAADKSLFAAIRESTKASDEIQQLSQWPWNRVSLSRLIESGPVTTQLALIFACYAARCDCIDAALAAELVRRRHGKWPETLDELVPDFLPSVPVDPCSDQPIKVASTPNGFKVYSVGRDGNDDGGFFGFRGGPPPDISFVIPLRSEFDE